MGGREGRVEREGIPRLVPLNTFSTRVPLKKVASLNVVMKEAVRDAVNRTAEKYETDRAQLTGESGGTVGKS